MPVGWDSLCSPAFCFPKIGQIFPDFCFYDSSFGAIRICFYSYFPDITQRCTLPFSRFPPGGNGIFVDFCFSRRREMPLSTIFDFPTTGKRYFRLFPTFPLAGNIVFIDFRYSLYRETSSSSIFNFPPSGKNFSKRLF